MSKFNFARKANRFRAELTRLSRRIGELGVQESMAAFDSQSWAGRSWTPGKRDYGHPLLQKTGRMKNSVRVLIANSKRVKWGSTLDYAQYQNLGTRRIPARPFIGLTPRLRRAIQKEIKLALNNSMRKV